MGGGGRRAWVACWVSLLIAPSLIAASATQAQPQPGHVPLDFEQAQRRLLEVSDAMAAAEAGVRGKAAELEASRRLRLPEIGIDVRRIQFEKTLELPLGSLAPVAEDYGIQSPLTFEFRDWRTRPSLTAILPLYTGGRIPAARNAAAAALRQSAAERELESQSLMVQLVQAYFGQQLAELAVDVRRDVRDGLERHLADARALEREGIATRAQRLQATVARDRAERDYQAAMGDLASARATLALLLRAGGDVEPTSGLFVHDAPVETLDALIASAATSHPQRLRLQALSEQASESVRVHRAELKPQVFAFGQYDLRHGDALLTDPDWVIGLGLKYTFLSGGGRMQRLAAAHAQHDRAEAGLREAGNRIEIGMTRAWNAMETARRQFGLLDSAIAEAEENLRLQELSFREGMATSLDVVDARLALGAVRVERAQAAYAYDVALAQLLEAGGQAHRFLEYSHTADKVLVP
ncbi:TolC family protein [Marilutibacter alkalisoli]|uniref:TolC family protein n=1 Tax=Marilutibacter alkalisoli TaxID=2591633 RepID=UPI001FCA0115|nr:TolC family protein [Lysobacter alkalisoli]